MFFARKSKYQSPTYFEAGTNWGNAFKMQLTRTVPVFSIVVSAECARAAGMMKVPRTAALAVPLSDFPDFAIKRTEKCVLHRSL